MCFPTIVLTLLAGLEAVLVSSTSTVQELLAHTVLAVIVPIGLEVITGALTLFQEAEFCSTKETSLVESNVVMPNAYYSAIVK